MRNIKIITFILFFLSNGVIQGFSQSTDQIIVNQKYYGKTMSDIFHSLAYHYHLELDVDKSLIPRGIVSGKSYYNEPIEEVLADLLKETGLHFKLSGKIIIIRKKGEAISVKLEKPVIYERKTNFKLSGIINDKSSGESLPFASIIVEGTKNGTTSNVDGYFTLFHLPSDTSVLLVNYIGYGTKRVFLTPQLVSSNIKIELESATKHLDEVTIIGEQRTLLKINNQISSIKLSPMKIAELPNIGEKDIMRSFQLMPGISASNEASSGLYVRGGTPDQNLVLYDGFTVYHVDHLFGFFSAFNSNAIKDVQLFKGGHSAKYGGRLSSVTELTGKEGDNKNFVLGGDISLLSFNAYTEFPINEKLIFLAAFRRSWKGPIYNLIFDQFMEEKESQTTDVGMRGGKMSNMETSVSSYFYDLNSKLTFKPNDKDIYSLSFYNGTDKLDNSRVFNPPSSLAGGASMQNDIIDLTGWGNTGSSLKWSRKWSPVLYGNMLMSYSQFFSTRDRSMEGVRTDQNGEVTSFKRGSVESNNLEDLSLKADYEWKLNGANQIGFGGQITNYNIKYDYIQNDTVSILNRDDDGTSYAFYLQNEITTLKKKLKITPGLRFSYFDVTGKTYTEPRLSGHFKLTNKLSLKGAWGKYYQFANRVIREDVLNGNREFWILADDIKIPVSSSVHNIVGISYETDNYIFDTEVYYKTFNGLSEYSLKFKPGFRSIDYQEYFYQGSGTARGIEFMAQKKFGKFNGWASYTFSDVIYDFPLLSEEPFPAAQDVTHEFKIVGLYTYKKWNFGAVFIYATGRPYTAPQGGYELTLLDGSVEDYITVGDKNGLRLPDYHRLDLSAKYNFESASKKGRKGSLSFGIFNVYNRENTWYKEYEIQDNVLYETDVTFLGFTPNVTLTIKF